MFWTVTLSLLEGFWVTLKLFGLTLALAIPFGLVLGLGSMSRFQPLKKVVDLLVWVIRGTPLLLQLIAIYYGPGLILNIGNIWGSDPSGRFTATLVAFVINYSCYFSVIYRGGIEAIPKGQYEAGQVLGMTKSQIFFKVTLLQVIKHILPPMSNEIITLVKDTSLARVVSYVEILLVAQEYTSKGLIWPMFSTGLFFLAFVGLLTLLFNWLERKLSYFK